MCLRTACTARPVSVCAHACCVFVWIGISSRPCGRGKSAGFPSVKSFDIARLREARTCTCIAHMQRHTHTLCSYLTEEHCEKAFCTSTRKRMRACLSLTPPLHDPPTPCSLDRSPCHILAHALPHSCTYVRSLSLPSAPLSLPSTFIIPAAANRASTRSAESDALRPLSTSTPVSVSLFLER